MHWFRSSEWAGPALVLTRVVARRRGRLRAGQVRSLRDRAVGIDWTVANPLYDAFVRNLRAVIDQPGNAW